MKQILTTFLTIALVLTVLLPFPYQAHAVTIARIGTDVTTSSGNLTNSVNHTLVAGTLGDRKVIVRVGAENNGDITGATVTYGGVAMTLVTDGSQTAFGETGTASFLAKSWVFELNEADLPADGVNAVSVTLSGTPNAAQTATVVSAFEGMSQSNPEDVTVLAEASPGNATMEASVTSTAGAWVLAQMMSGTAGDLSWGVGSETAEVDPASASMVFAVAELQSVSAGSYTPAATLNTTLQRGVFISVSFPPAEDAPDPVSPQLMINNGRFVVDNGKIIID